MRSRNPASLIVNDAAAGYRAEQVMAVRSGHNVQEDEPGLVVAAIGRVIERAGRNPDESVRALYGGAATGVAASRYARSSCANLAGDSSGG